MSYLDRDTYGMYKNENESGPGPRLMGAETLIGNDVYNLEDEDLGDIKEIMLDMENGEVRYAVLSFGGFLGIVLAPKENPAYSEIAPCDSRGSDQ